MKEKPIYEQLGYSPDPPFYASTPASHQRQSLTNADLLRAESDEGLADAIFYTLSEFQSKEALLAYLREEVNTDT